jgi:hypothetical protein
MDIFHTIVTARAIFILGIVNIFTGLLVFLSCRCLQGIKLAKKLMQYKAFLRFYKYHCYIWWFFWAGVIIHAILAITFFGWPG